MTILENIWPTCSLPHPSGESTFTWSYVWRLVENNSWKHSFSEVIIHLNLNKFRNFELWLNSVKQRRTIQDAKTKYDKYLAENSLNNPKKYEPLSAQKLIKSKW